MMKLYIPQIKEEFVLEKTWIVSLDDDYYLSLLEKIDIKNYNGEIRIPKGSTIKIMDISMYRKKITGIYIQITRIFNKKVKRNITFIVNLNDINRMYIESSATQGVLNLDIGWVSHHIYNKGYNFSSYSPPENGKEVMTGYINKTKVFIIRITDFDIETKTYKNGWNNNIQHHEIISSIKYGAYELISDDGKESLIGEWGTTQTCKKHLSKFLDDNKSKFLDNNQKKMLRSDKLERLAKEIKEK